MTKEEFIRQKKEAKKEMDLSDRSIEGWSDIILGKSKKNGGGQKMGVRLQQVKYSFLAEITDEEWKELEGSIVIENNDGSYSLACEDRELDEAVRIAREDKRLISDSLVEKIRKWPQDSEGYISFIVE